MAVIGKVTSVLPVRFAGAMLQGVNGIHVLT